MHTISPELTFVPRRAPHELVDRKKAEQLAERIRKDLYRRTNYFRVKLDPFHHEYTKQETWCVEIVPFDWFLTDWFTNDTHWKNLKEHLDIVWSIMRKHGMVSTLVTKTGNTEKHWPGGGCHLHYGSALVMAGTHWYSTSEKFHRNLGMDYANRPWIRWLFSQWFANTHLVPVNSEDLKIANTNPDHLSNDNLFDRSIYHRWGLEPRFMGGGTKSHYLTFEFRMFSMVRDPKELQLIILFLNRWIEQILFKTYSSEEQISLNLTKHKLLQMKQLGKSWEICKDYLDFLKLPSDAYRVFYKRNYSNRIKYGQLT